MFQIITLVKLNQGSRNKFKNYKGHFPLNYKYYTVSSKMNCRLLHSKSRQFILLVTVYLWGPFVLLLKVFTSLPFVALFELFGRSKVPVQSVSKLLLEWDVFTFNMFAKSVLPGGSSMFKSSKILNLVSEGFHIYLRVPVIYNYPINLKDSFKIIFKYLYEGLPRYG